MQKDIILIGLSEKFIPFSQLNSVWKYRLQYKASAEVPLRRFIDINVKSFKFLSITCSIAYREGKAGLEFQTSQFVGAAPLYSPSNGKPYGDLIVNSRFGEDLSLLINLLSTNLEIEYAPFNLVNPIAFRPPKYLDLIEFMRAFEKATQLNWAKFINRSRKEAAPNGNTDWNDYSKRYYNVNERLQYKNHVSLLSREHDTWIRLTALLSKSLAQFKSMPIPAKIKQQTAILVERLTLYINRFPHHNLNSAKFIASPNDPPSIKTLLEIANKLLADNPIANRGWKVDMALIFERYVQYIVQEATKGTTLTPKTNPRYSLVKTFKASWGLAYLEPDIILSKHLKDCIVIDAKYKSHLFNLHHNSDSLHQTFRSDLHQILAYTTVIESKNRIGILIYPSNTAPRLETIHLNRRGHDPAATIYIVGLSLSNDMTQQNIKYLQGLFSLLQ